MRYYSVILLLIVLALNSYPESPHGKKFKVDCASCHSTSNWELKEKNNFNHSKTGFPLEGQHKMLKCRECHTSLVFSQAAKTCANCHKDMHQGTVGTDCNRCHTTRSWIVTNIRQIHQRRGFALIGQHASQDCNMCHPGSNQLRFENRRSDCAACHLGQFNAARILISGHTKAISHKDIPYSGNLHDCLACHNMVGQSWSARGKGFEHGFFPLKGGHAGVKCSDCHRSGSSPSGATKLDQECSSCHSSNKGKLKVPAHGSKFKEFSCSNCHNISGWNNVRMSAHDGWFKISSGRHKGVGCLECHNNNTEFKPNCRKCHSWDYSD